MGLIKCSKCGKVYDYDKYDGICPKCARYNSESTSEEDHQALHDEYDGGYEHNEQDSHHVFHEKYDDEQNPHDEENRIDVLNNTMIDTVKDAVNQGNFDWMAYLSAHKGVLVGVIILLFILFMTPLGLFFPLVIIVAVISLAKKQK